MEIDLPTWTILRSLRASLSDMERGLDTLARRAEAKRLEVRTGYEALAKILDEALAQAQSGKGHVRHAGGELRWEDQDSGQITREVGGGYPAGQYAKKLAEADRLPYEQARQDILGAIVYAALRLHELDRQHSILDEAFVSAYTASIDRAIRGNK